MGRLAGISNMGLKMLQKMGYKGGGLGKDGSGITKAIEAKKRVAGEGLGNRPEHKQELKPEDTDVIIDKNRPSSFYATRLESYLRAQQIENVVVCGVTTNICVETTVRDASQRDFRTFVVRDAVGEVDDFRGQTALKAMEYLFARVMNVNDVLDEWGVELSNAA